MKVEVQKMSRVERILQAIIDGTSYGEAPQSRIEEILLAIKNNTDYLKLPYSRIETLLLAIKDNGDYSDLLQSRIEEILEHKLHNTVYEKDALSRIEKLLIDWINKADYYELAGVPPLTFVSNGKNLVDYRIYGASGGVGDKTDNLWNEKATTDTDKYINASGDIGTAVESRYLCLKVNVSPSTNYAFKWTESVLGTDGTTSYIRISEYTQSDRFIRRVLCNCSEQTQKAFSFTTDRNTSYIDVRIESATSLKGQHLTGVMLITGTIPPEIYEPYGYKIPVVCGGTTTNIYLDKPLSEGESISMSDTGVSIPTINGTNILTVDTEVQPSNVYLKYKGG